MFACVGVGVLVCLCRYVHVDAYKRAHTRAHTQIATVRIYVRTGRRKRMYAYTQIYKMCSRLLEQRLSDPMVQGAR